MLIKSVSVLDQCSLHYVNVVLNASSPLCRTDLPDSSPGTVRFPDERAQNAHASACLCAKFSPFQVRKTKESRWWIVLVNVIFLLTHFVSGF